MKRKILHAPWRRILFFPHLECKWNICPRFVTTFWPQTQEYILCWIISPDGQYIYSLTTCAMWYIILYLSLFTTAWYERVIYCSMSFVCLLIGLITCWRKNRPYNCFVCCNLCFVSVKEVEKWVSWLLVSVEMAPSEIVLEDSSPGWYGKKRYGS